MGLFDTLNKGSAWGHPRVEPTGVEVELPLHLANSPFRITKQNTRNGFYFPKYDPRGWYQANWADGFYQNFGWYRGPMPTHIGGYQDDLQSTITCGNHQWEASNVRKDLFGNHHCAGLKVWDRRTPAIEQMDGGPMASGNPIGPFVDGSALRYLASVPVDLHRPGFATHGAIGTDGDAAPGDFALAHGTILQPLPTAELQEAAEEFLPPPTATKLFHRGGVDSMSAGPTTGPQGWCAFNLTPNEVEPRDLTAFNRVAERGVTFIEMRLAA